MFMNCSTIISLHGLKHQSNQLGSHVQNDAMLHSVSKGTSSVMWKIFLSPVTQYTACSHLYNLSSLLPVPKGKGWRDYGALAAGGGFVKNTFRESTHFSFFFRLLAEHCERMTDLLRTSYDERNVRYASIPAGRNYVRLQQKLLILINWNHTRCFTG
ncbi:hypothetical protein Tco_0592384 [Tanacetum coccineum]